MSNSDDDYDDLILRRRRFARAVAWVVIGAMVLVGGGATVLSLIFG